MTTEDDADTTIIAELEKIVDSVRPYFEHYAYQERLGIWVERPQDAPDFSSVALALEAHPQFQSTTCRFFDVKQLRLGPLFQCWNLVKITVEQGAPAALTWLRKITSTSVTDLRYIAAVYGLRLIGRQVLGNGVALVPLTELAPSPNVKAVLRQPQFWPGAINRAASFVIAAMLEVPQVPSADDRSASRAARAQEVLERTIKAFTLVDNAAPVVVTSWLEYLDQDLAKAEFGGTWMMHSYEGTLDFLPPVDVNSNALIWVERYLQLKPEVRSICDVAIDQLNIARRR